MRFRPIAAAPNRRSSRGDIAASCLSLARPFRPSSNKRAGEKSFARETQRRARDHGALFTLDRLTRARFKLAYRRRPKAIVARLARPGPVLDRGCGDGNSLNPPPAGYIPFGIEVSKGLAATADLAFRLFGGKCIRAAAEGLATFPPKYVTASCSATPSMSPIRSRSCAAWTAAHRRFHRHRQNAELRFDQSPRHRVQVVRVSPAGSR